MLRPHYQLPRTIVLRMACSALPVSCPSRRHVRGPRPPAVLARKPAASTSLAMCRLVRGGHLDLWRRGLGPQNPYFQVLGEMVAPGNWVRRWEGTRPLGHEEGHDSILKPPCQVSSTPNLPLGAVLQRVPASLRLGPRCPQPPISTSSTEQTVFQPPSPLTGLSEEPRNMWLEVSTWPQPAAPHVLIN